MSYEFEERTTKELKCLNTELERVNKKIDVGLAQVNKRLDNHVKKFDEITKILESLRRSVVLIEQKVTVDIPALFDGYTAHQEIQERQQGEIDSINKKVDNHNIRISILEQKTV